MPLYARSGIAELWIVDVAKGILESYRRPDGSLYREAKLHKPGERLAIALAPDIVVDLGTLFG